MSSESPNTLNIEQNVTKQIKIDADRLIESLYSANEEPGASAALLHSKIIDSDIVAKCDKIRNEIINLLELKCSIIFRDFNTNYNQFIRDYGWTEDLTRERHKITRDELAYELCEVIRKVYYTYTEDRFPEIYKKNITDPYLLKVNHVPEN